MSNGTLRYVILPLQSHLQSLPCKSIHLHYFVHMTMSFGGSQGNMPSQLVGKTGFCQALCTGTQDTKLHELLLTLLDKMLFKKKWSCLIWRHCLLRLTGIPSR